MIICFGKMFSMSLHLDPPVVGAAVLEIWKVLLLIFYTINQIQRFNFLLILQMVSCIIYSQLFKLSISWLLSFCSLMEKNGDHSSLMHELAVEYALQRRKKALKGVFLPVYLSTGRALWKGIAEILLCPKKMRLQDSLSSSMCSEIELLVLS